MSSIKIATGELLMLLNQLDSTASDEGPMAGILLHTTRGSLGTEPGKTDLLVGTSADGIVIGHTTARADGQLSRAVLVSIADVDAIIASFRPKLKAKKDHHVMVSLDDGKVTVAEEDDLLREGLKLTFTECPLSNYPRELWQLLSDVRINPQVDDGKGGLVAVSDRTDINPAALGPFVKVARMVGAPVELYRAHQSLPILVQVGARFRGVLMPQVYEDAGAFPDATVYPPDLPPLPDRDAVDPDNTTRIGILSTGSGLVLGHLHTDGQVITSFPEVERDPSLLCEAAEHVITAQTGSVSLLCRKMRIGHATATRLMSQLEDRGVVGPAVGTKARKVRVALVDLPAVLEAIRGPQPDATAPAPLQHQHDFLLTNEDKNEGVTSCSCGWRSEFEETEPDGEIHWNAHIEPTDVPIPGPRYEVRPHGPEIGGVDGFGVFDTVDGQLVTFGWDEDQIQEQLARVIAESDVDGGE